MVRVRVIIVRIFRRRNLPHLRPQSECAHQRVLKGAKKYKRIVKTIKFKTPKAILIIHFVWYFQY